MGIGRDDKYGVGRINVWRAIAPMRMWVTDYHRGSAIVEQSLMELSSHASWSCWSCRISIFVVKQTYQDALRREQDNAQAHRDDKVQVIAALKENAKAMTALENAIEGLTRERRREYNENT